MIVPSDGLHTRESMGGHKKGKKGKGKKKKKIAVAVRR